jgi:hypothetical protein
MGRLGRTTYTVHLITAVAIDSCCKIDKALREIMVLFGLQLVTSHFLLDKLPINRIFIIVNVSDIKEAFTAAK